MRINGLGYCVTDNLYSPIDFESEGYKKWLSDNNNDIGLITGGLVFAKELERSSGKSYRDILNEITGRIDPKINIGGPAIVAMINIVQMVDENEVSIGYFGARGDDKSGCYIADKLKAMNIDLSGYITVRGQTSFTDVLSDPSYNSNNGERSFVCYIGTGGTLSGKDILDSFFDADILIYGGTGLTPGLHDDLSYLLKKGKKANCLNFVNTVYDFRNEKLNPGKPWPLVEEEEDFYLIGLFEKRILSSSTFAFWASALADNDKSVVIAPEYWSPNSRREIRLPNEIRI